MPRQGRDTTKHENRSGRTGSLEFYFRVKPPCPAFGGVAPPNMKIEQVAGGTSNSIFELKNQILLKMGRNYFRTGLKPGQNEGFGTYWGWSILVPACPWDIINRKN
jgi:hypothetical protein